VSSLSIRIGVTQWACRVGHRRLSYAKVASACARRTVRGDRGTDEREHEEQRRSCRPFRDGSDLRAEIPKSGRTADLDRPVATSRATYSKAELNERLQLRDRKAALSDCFWVLGTSGQGAKAPTNGHPLSLPLILKPVKLLQRWS
jgi:hypothetical protein